MSGKEQPVNGAPAPAGAPLFSGKALRALIIPLVVEQLLAVTIGMADTMMVTTAGEAAVAGVNLVDSINLLLIQVFAALATGGAVVASQYLGRRDEGAACAAAKQLVYSSTAAALGIMAVTLLLRRQILSLLFGHVEQAVMESALIYLLLTALSFPALAIFNSGAALFRSMGNGRVSMVISLLMNIVNISGNAVFIFRMGWGAGGAGTATLISRSLGAVIMLALICQKKHVIHVEKLWKPELRWGLVGTIMKVGVPSGIENSMLQIGKLLVQRLTSSFGTAAIAANAIAASAASVVSIPGGAMSLALITVVGQCMGARDPDQAVRYTKKLLLATYIFVGSLSTILFLITVPLVGCFSLSPEAAGMAIQVLRYYAVFAMLLWPPAFFLPNTLRAAGDARFTMVVSLASMWTFRIALSYVLGGTLGLGLLGVWYAMFVDWVVRGAIFVIRFVRGRWKEIRLI